MPLPNELMVMASAVDLRGKTVLEARKTIYEFTKCFTMMCDAAVYTKQIENLVPLVEKDLFVQSVCNVWDHRTNAIGGLEDLLGISRSSPSTVITREKALSMYQESMLGVAKKLEAEKAKEALTVKQAESRLQRLTKTTPDERLSRAIQQEVGVALKSQSHGYSKQSDKDIDYVAAVAQGTVTQTMINRKADRPAVDGRTPKPTHGKNPQAKPKAKAAPKAKSTPKGGSSGPAGSGGKGGKAPKGEGKAQKGKGKGKKKGDKDSKGQSKGKNKAGGKGGKKGQ